MDPNEEQVPKAINKRTPEGKTVPTKLEDMYPFLSNQEFQLYLFTPDRKKIYNRVNQRFINMVDSGAIDEVKKLNTLDLDKSLPIMRAHGVPEISSYLSGKTSLEECIHKGQQVTRNYVKRQLTWWRSSSLDNLKCFDQFPSEIDTNLLNFS